MEDSLHRLLVSRPELVEPTVALAQELGLPVKVVRDQDRAADEQEAAGTRRDAARHYDDPEVFPEAMRDHGKAVVGMGGAVLLLECSDKEKLSKFNERYRALLRG